MATWQLSVLVADEETVVDVGDNTHAGGVMMRVVQKQEIQADWSDHMLFWPSKSIWLINSRTTLAQYGITSGDVLCFTPRHKNITIQLPNLQTVSCRINFSSSVFAVVGKMCKELALRHPEELSLMKKLEPSDLKKDHGISATKRTKIRKQAPKASTETLNGRKTGSSESFLTPDTTLARGSSTNLLEKSSINHSINNSMDSLDLKATIILDYLSDFQGDYLLEAKNVQEMARINSAWLDSSVSLLEQGVTCDDILLLRYKFFDFYDLNPKLDEVRLQHIYHQAKSSILRSQVACSTDDALLLAALQWYIEQGSRWQENSKNGGENKEMTESDEVNDALLALEKDLLLEEEYNGSNICDKFKAPPEYLEDHMKCYRPKKFHIKSYKKYWFTLYDNILDISDRQVYKKDDQSHVLKKFKFDENTLSVYSALKGDEYIIRLIISSKEDSTELWIKQNDQDQYVRWLAALRTVSKASTLCDQSTYKEEEKVIFSKLNLQKRNNTKHVVNVELNSNGLCDILPKKIVDKCSKKETIKEIQRIVSNLGEMSREQAELQYIQICQRLPDFGVSHFIIETKNSKKKEVLSIGVDRLVKRDLNTNNVTRVLMYKDIQVWSVNWETKQVILSFEVDHPLVFQCLTADCKTVHEFIGGHIFLSMRGTDQKEALNEELFHKLTGGWD